MQFTADNFSLIYREITDLSLALTFVKKQDQKEIRIFARKIYIYKI